MKIAIVAHDSKKALLVNFVIQHQKFFSKHTLVATAHTGELLKEKGFDVIIKPHGPQGGDVLIAAMIVQREIELVFFFRDLLAPQGHDHDINTLIRMSDMYDVPIAINLATAECLVHSFQ